MIRRIPPGLVALVLLADGFAYGQQFSVAESRITRHAKAARDGEPSVNGFSAPVLGYLLDGAGAVRKMPGVAGATWLTGPLEFGVVLAAGAVSPRQDYLLGLAAPDRRPMVLPLAALAGARTLDGVAAGADRVVLSPSGTAAVFYFSQTASLTIVTGLPDSPVPGGNVDLSGLPAPPAGLAISDDGSVILASASTSDGAAVFVLSAQSAPRLLLNGGDFPALAFRRRSLDAVLADRLRNALYWAGDVAGPGEVVLLAGESDGVSAPIAVAASADGARIFVANSGSATIGYLSAAGGPLTLLSCSCSPAALAPLSGNAVFRLTEFSNDPIWLLDGDASEPRLLLAPQPSSGRTAR